MVAKVKAKTKEKPAAKKKMAGKAAGKAETPLGKYARELKGMTK